MGQGGRGPLKSCEFVLYLREFFPKDFFEIWEGKGRVWTWRENEMEGKGG
jgi:hypothetical protein